MLLHRGQHSPSGKNGFSQVTVGHKISSQTTFPLVKKKKKAFRNTELRKQKKKSICKKMSKKLVKVCLHSSEAGQISHQFDEFFDKNRKKLEFCNFHIFIKKRFPSKTCLDTRYLGIFVVIRAFSQYLASATIAQDKIIEKKRQGSEITSGKSTFYMPHAWLSIDSHPHKPSFRRHI